MGFMLGDMIICLFVLVMWVIFLIVSMVFVLMVVCLVKLVVIRWMFFSGLGEFSGILIWLILVLISVWLMGSVLVGVRLCRMVMMGWVMGFFYVMVVWVVVRLDSISVVLFMIWVFVFVCVNV